MDTCYLVGAAPGAEKIHPQAGDYVIAADGGIDHLQRWGITPDFILGDLDSATTALPKHVPCKTYDSRKDETDLELALREGLQRGLRRFLLVGAGGGRPDHAYANLQLLVQAARAGAFAVLKNDGFSATAIADSGSMLLQGKGVLSVFSFGGDAEGVTITGAEYPLENATLHSDELRGISNELHGTTAEISLKKGALLVFWESEKAEALVNI